MKHTFSGLAALIILLFIPGLVFARSKTECDASNYRRFIYIEGEHNCYLQGVILISANLIGANLIGANLYLAHLTDVTGLSPEQREYARAQGAILE